MLWRHLRWRLIRLFLKYSQRSVLEQWGNPVETFKEAHMHGDWARFVTYVVWLKQFPSTIEWYLTVEEQFGTQIPPLLVLIGHWIQ